MICRRAALSGVVLMLAACSTDPPATPPADAGSVPARRSPPTIAATPWAAAPVKRSADNGAAARAAVLLERAVRLPDEERRRWVSAYTSSRAAATSADFLDRWLGTLLDGNDVDPVAAAGAGTATGVSLATLGARTLERGDGGHGVRVILWQEVTVAARPSPRRAYVLTFVTVVQDGGVPVVDAVDGIRPGPPPNEGTRGAYPELPL